MEESMRGALQSLYSRHYTDVTSLSCYLERHLPLREPFFQLKRVPHFQVRDDLHHSEAPAYTPILRLESASPEDVSQRGRAGSRRVCVEGELGTGKTFLCYHLLQLWARPRPRPPHPLLLTPAPAATTTTTTTTLAKTPRLDDITTFTLLIYVDCVRLPVSDLLSRCHPSRKRHVFVIACALTELLSPNESRAFLDRVYDWLIRNQSEVCVVFDNLDGSDSWNRLVEETLREHHHTGFGKVVVCSTPGRISKTNIDSLYYCYGLHPDYSHKLVVSKLKRVSQDIVDRAEIPKLLDPSQELLRNPLTQSLVIAFLKSMNPKARPRTQFDFIEDVVSTAMVGDSYPVSLSSGPRSSQILSPSSPSCLMSICETVAFECLESNTNYFSKVKFPAHFWNKHLCDCRILHEVHDINQQGTPVISFTSRSIRDYLASKRVCRYLLSDRDSDQFLDGLVHKRQFHSVVKFCIRHLVKLNRLDMVRILIERLLAAGPKRWIKAHKQAEAFSRGRLSEQSEVLAWLRETDFHVDLLRVVTAHFPSILELSYSDCPPDTLRHFTAVAETSGQELPLQGLVLYMDGMFMNSALGLDLARALRRVSSLTTLVVCLRCVVDTGFVVDFLCQVFESNPHVKNLTLEGPFNSAENLTPAMHRRVKQAFSGGGPAAPSLGLQTLCVEHVNYHHRLAYLLSCWPHSLFRRLELRKSNLNSVSQSLRDKLYHGRHLSTLVLEHCHVLSATLESVLQGLCEAWDHLVLTSLTLSLLSTSRHFARQDARKPSFRPSLTLHGCRLLARFLSLSPTLSDMSLCHDGIDDAKVRVLVEAASRSETLTSLDLTGNVIGDASCEDVIAVVTGSRKLSALYLHDNSFGADVRKVLVNCSLEKTSFKLSL
ncbi:uncharacterized protein LOC143275572 [Babylonia areolata]|uniref:uncharacterized protein LOC143275572 n=1 Tax=Babylonia areolata TaxID=304850 RepID=UPI003FD1C846